MFMLQFYTYKLLRRPAAYFFKKIVIKRSKFRLDRANKKLHVDFAGVLGKFLGLTLVDLELLPPEIKRVLDIRQWYLARRLLYPRRNRFFNQIRRPDVKVRLKTKAKSFKIFKGARIGAKILDLNLRWKLIYPCYFGIEAQVFGQKSTKTPGFRKKDTGVQVFRGERKEMRAVFFFLILGLLSYRSVFKRGRFSLINLGEPMEWQRFIATRVKRREEAGGPEKLDRFYDEFYGQNYMTKYRKKKEFYLRFVDERTDEQKKQEAEIKAWAKKYRRPIKSDGRPIEYMFSFDGLIKELWRIKIKKAASLIIFKQGYFKKLVKISSAWNVKLGSQFRKKLTNLYPVRYADTSINKFLTHDRIKRMKIFF